MFQQYSEYEKVVIEDRVAKEQARRKAEQELEELKSAIKVSLTFVRLMDSRFLCLAFLMFLPKPDVEGCYLD